MFKKFKLAFTTAEVLTVLSLMGVVAAVTVPSIVYNYKMSEIRTTLKKGMTTYESAAMLLRAERRLGSYDGVTCSMARRYFKILKDTADECKFTTSDGLAWDITDFDKTIVGLKVADLTTAKAKNADLVTTFYMVAEFDGRQRPRINDKGFNYTDADKNDGMAKLYNFVNKQ